MARNQKAPNVKTDTAVPPSHTPIYILDQNHIALGDILLTTDPEGKESKAIRVITNSPFSHAALCIEYGHFIEAIGPGVCRLAIMGTGARAKENIQLLRLSEKAVPDAGRKAAAAAKRGEWFLSRGYSTSGALGVKLSILRDPTRAELFCSQLVARAYEEVGVELVPGKQAEAIAPGELANSPLLRDITASAIVLAHVDEPPDHYLDGPHFDRPHHREVIAKFNVLNSKPVRSALARLQEKPNSFHELEIVLAQRMDRQLDGATVSELEKVHFADIWGDVQEYANADQIEEETRKILGKIHRGAMSDDELRVVIWRDSTIHKQLEEAVTHRRQELNVYELGKQRLATFAYFAPLQRRLLATTIDNLNKITRRLNALIPETQRRKMKPGPPV